MKRIYSILLLAVLTLPMMGQKDVITTTDSHRIEAIIISMTADSVGYNMPGVPITLSLPMKQVATIVYRTGDTVRYNEIAAEATAPAAAEPVYDVDIAAVYKFHGIYVFTECTPIAPYEVIGTVSYSGSHGAVGYSVAPGVAVATDVSAQYTSIRSGLVRAALAASNEVQGIMIEADQEGAGIARMIRFKSPENNQFARVKKNGGYYIFIDNEPTVSYNSYGSVDCMLAKTTVYTDIMNKLIRKADNHHTPANSLMIKFVEGGVDKGRMILTHK